VECGSCGSINRDGARFCIGCGAPLAARCPSCDNELPPGAKFCDSCGAPLHDAAPVPIVAPTRKIVTILFSDLTGSTGLGERLDPESVRAIMTPVYASMRNEVEARGGIVTKFVGDGVMAAFGIRDIREDDAIRAVDAAVGMQQAIARLSLDLPVALSLKVGVNTGEVVVGLGDEDIVGDCVNVASRLEGAAAPGEVLVGEETWRLTRASATYEAVAPLTLKGKAQPVRAYRLVSLERTQEAGTATFVGRDDDLARLIGAFDEAVEASASRLATIVGSPGLGKTRLARELGATLTDRALVVETRCDVAGTATFAPVADALRSAAGIDESASPDEVLAAIAALVPDDDDRDRIAVRAASILGAGEPGSTEETFWAIRRIVETAAKVTPMVLVLDDLHWAEPLLLDLVEHLVEWNRTSPVLIVVTGRPELREMRPRITERAISLEGLDGAATEALACGLLGTDRVPRELLARLPASTEGNPLFVREFVRMLVDDGILRRSGDAWVATIDVDAIQVPPTIHSLLAARVDRLTPHERTVLELASVIGKEFYLGAIAELAPAAVQIDLSAHLESLRRKELVEPSGAYWIDEPVFRFHHALIRDAAYRRLLKESRAELHERVADWLERKTGGLLGEHDEQIGYHLEQAHACRQELGSDDEHVHELGRRAGRLLASAARHALDLDDLPSAAVLAGRSLERLDPEDPVRSEVLIVRCESLLATGDVSGASEAVAQLERGAASSPRLRAWATCFTGELTNMTDPSRLRDTEEGVAAAAAEFVSLADPAGAAKAYTVQAVALAGLGRVADCESALDRALNAAREAGDRRRVTAVLAFAPVAALWGPSPVSRAGGRCLDIVRLLRITTGSPAVEATSERCQAVLEAFRGRAPAARRMLERVHAKVEALGLRQGLLDTQLFAGIVELIARDPSAAERHLRDAHDGFRAMGNDVSTARSAALLARALLALESEGEAAVYAAESERLGGDDLKNAIAWRAVRAELLARRGEVSYARRLAEEAVEIARRTDALVDHADACMALAEVCRRTGDTQGARRAADEAIALYERKGATAYVESVAPIPAEVRLSGSFEGSSTNRSTEFTAAVMWAILEGNIEPFESALTETSVVDDRRKLGGGLTEGRAAIVAYGRSLIEIGITWFGGSVIATRGDLLNLSRGTLAGPDTGHPLDVEVLAVWEISSAGELVANVIFDPDQLDEAFAELERRYLAGEGSVSSRPELENRASRINELGLDHVAEGDVDAVAALMADDYAWVDHRAGLAIEVIGKKAAVAHERQIADIPITRVESENVAIRGERLVLAHERFFADGTDPWEFEALNVCEINEEGLLIRDDVFDAQDLAAAHTYLEERFAEGEGAAFADVLAVFRGLQAAFGSADWDEFKKYVTDDIIDVDHRAASFDETRGAAAHIEKIRSISGLAKAVVLGRSTDRINERGLASLVEVRGITADGAEIEIAFWSVWIVDEGKVTRVERFPSDEKDAALARFDELTRPPDAADNLARRVSLAANAAFAGRDWETLRSMYSPDAVVRDLRTNLRSEVAGREEILANLQAMADMGAVSLQQTVLAMSGERALLVRDRARGGEPSKEFDVEYLTLLELAPDGAIQQETIFDRDDEERALAALSVSTANDADAGTTRHALENRCVRTWMEACRCIERGDWDEAAELCREDVVSETRRAGLGHITTGRDRFIDDLRAARSVGVERVHLVPVAIRGEKLALGRIVATGSQPDSFSAELLNVVEIDNDGRLARETLFDPADLRTALTYLDERFMAGEGAEHAEIIRLGATFSASVSRFDEATLRALIADDFYQKDHRLTSLPEMHGPDGILESVRTFREVMPDLQFYVQRFHRLADAGYVVSMVTTGHSDAGAAGEVVFVAASIFRDGKIHRVERFEPDDVDRALARFDELTASRAPQSLENLATRAVRRRAALAIAHDWDAYRRTMREDVTTEDRRAGLGHLLRGPAELTASMREAVELGTEELTVEPLATRGERLCLAKQSFRTKDFVAEYVVVVEVDGDGSVLANVMFDLSDVAAALIELDDRYAAREGADQGPVVQRYAYLTAAINARDWTAYRAMFHPGFRFADHRAASLGEISDAGRLVDAHKALIDVLPDGSIGVAHYEALDDACALAQMTIAGHSTDGAAVDLSLLATVSWKDGLIDRLDFFPLDAPDVARSRFDELTSDAARVAEIHNTSVRVAKRFEAAFNGQNWDALRALYREDVALDDRRRQLGRSSATRDELIEGLRTLGDLASWRVRFEPLATRGETLGLLRVTRGTADGWLVEHLLVFEVDDSGLVVRHTNFDADDLDAAFAELDDRFEAVRPAWRGVARALRALNDSDWEACAASFATEVLYEDHRPASLGTTTGVQAFIALLQSLVKVIPDLSSRVLSVERFDKDVFFTRTQVVGTNQSGGEVEIASWAVARVVDGRVDYMAEFPLDAREQAIATYDERHAQVDVASAVARFEELAADSSDG